MSGLLALLDDVAAIAKMAASSVDDIAAAAGRAGSKTAGVLIDDAAVTPSLVKGFAPARELPMIWRIARGSVFNKLVILLPLAMVLASFAPWLITPLLMLGGCYLSFEGAEKIVHALWPHSGGRLEADFATGDSAHLEQEKVRGAIKTDFILSAEIMTIALAAIEAPNLWVQAAALALVALMVTVGVYGAVAVIVKMDDIGLYLARSARTGAVRMAGRGLVKLMPFLLALLTVIGTAAMLWVGGAIIRHGLESFGVTEPGHSIAAIAGAAAHALPAGSAAIAPMLTGALDAVFGLVVGGVLIVPVTRLLAPLIEAVTGKTGKQERHD